MLKRKVSGDHNHEKTTKRRKQKERCKRRRKRESAKFSSKILNLFCFFFQFHPFLKKYRPFVCCSFFAVQQRMNVSFFSSPLFSPPCPAQFQSFIGKTSPKEQFVSHTTVKEMPMREELELVFSTHALIVLRGSSLLSHSPFSTVYSVEEEKDNSSCFRIQFANPKPKAKVRLFSLFSHFRRINPQPPTQSTKKKLSLGHSSQITSGKEIYGS